jgi:hypothetical protein
MCEEIIGQEIENLLLQFKSRQATKNAYHEGARTALAV